jgi:hypothetical protein
MSKLQLRVEELEVETFDLLPRLSGKGTVRGHEDSVESGCDSVDACCQAGTHGGDGCDSTQYQDLCGCTHGGPDNTTCDVNLTCGVYGSCYQMTCLGPQDHTNCTGG